MNRISRLFLMVTALVVASVSVGSAQGLRTSYFMDNVPLRLKMNPAFQPTKGFFSLPALGSLGLMASSNSISMSDFSDIMDDDNGFLSEKFINNLEKDNTMTIDLNTDVISFGFFAGRSFWTINVGARVIFNASIPKTMFEFARNAGEVNPGDHYEIENFEIWKRSATLSIDFMMRKIPFLSRNSMAFILSFFVMSLIGFPIRSNDWPMR